MTKSSNKDGEEANTEDANKKEVIGNEDDKSKIIKEDYQIFMYDVGGPMERMRLENTM